MLHEIWSFIESFFVLTSIQIFTVVGLLSFQHTAPLANKLEMLLYILKMRTAYHNKDASLVMSDYQRENAVYLWFQLSRSSESNFPTRTNIFSNYSLQNWDQIRALCMHQNVLFHWTTMLQSHMTIESIA